MTSEKICPIMSRPSSHLFNRTFGYRVGQAREYAELYNDFVPCQKEKCKAWKLPKDEQSEGYCKLIGDND